MKDPQPSDWGIRGAAAAATFVGRNERSPTFPVGGFEDVFSFSLSLDVSHDVPRHLLGRDSSLVLYRKIWRSMSFSQSLLNSTLDRRSFSLHFERVTKHHL